MTEYQLHDDYSNHEKLVELHNSLDDELVGYVAIHNTNLGPALGGTRVFQYRDSNSALSDVLKLSKAMTYKCAIAGVPFGGGKAVIILKDKDRLSSDQLKNYALKIKDLSGQFYTGEDVGLSEAEVQLMLEHSPYFIGKTGQAGDPSEYAALSAFLTMKTALKSFFGSDSLEGRTVSVKGVGKTGTALVNFLLNDGVSKIFIADINQDRVDSVVKLDNRISAVSKNEIMSQETDVFSPCAMGGDLNPANINLLKAKIIAGTANNQLSDPESAELIHRSGVLYVPDFLANAGGLINVADELMPGGYNKGRVINSIKNLQKTYEFILKQVSNTNQNPHVVASKFAEQKFQII